MKIFKVHVNNLEYLLQQDIEADNVEEAKEKYIKLWEEGMIAVNDSEFQNWHIEETT